MFNKTEWSKKYKQTQRYKDWATAYDRKRHKGYRSKIFDILGRECIICGENRIECLQFDHINDNGAEHKRLLMGEKIRDGTMGYNKLLLKDPQLKNIIQVLCANCNWIKRSIREELLWLQRRGIPPF